MTSATSSAQRQSRRGRRAVARSGLVGRAMLYTVLGVLALDIARGDGGSSTTQGAIEQFARGDGGRILIVVLCLGLLALVVWKALQAIAGDPVEGSEASDRATHAIKGATYTGVLAAALAVLAANWGAGGGGSGGGGGGSTEQQTTATVLEWPGGQFIVIAVGLGVIGFAAYETFQHVVHTEFVQRLDRSALSSGAADSVEWSGRVGYGAKAITTAIIGGFFVVAGLQHDPDEAKGLSAALQELSDSSWGLAVLWLVAIGMFLFAAFSLVEAWLRRAT